MEHIRGSGAPECIFHYQHKTLNNLVSPGPAASCVADKQVYHREIYTSCSNLQHFIRVGYLFQPWMRSHGTIGFY